MAREIGIDLVSDTSDFERSMKNAGDSVESLERDLKDTAAQANKFDSALDKTNGGLDNAAGKFSSTASLAGGLGAVLGIEGADQVATYAQGIADMADGLGGLLAPMLLKAKGAFMAMNATMLANPVFLVIAAIAALTAAFVIAYKKSETFRAIVNGAFDAVKRGAQAFSDAVVKSVQWVTGKLSGVAELIVRPYREAFRAIAWLWNNTVGKLSFSVPGWVPGVGGKGFDVPDIPMLAAGGIVNKPTLAMIGEAGPEAVVPLSGPNAGGFGGAQRLEIVLSGDAELVALMRRSIRTRGGNVQVVMGSS